MFITKTSGRSGCISKREFDKRTRRRTSYILKRGEPYRSKIVIDLFKGGGGGVNMQLHSLNNKAYPRQTTRKSPSVGLLTF